jgi:hypothetical protein
MASLQSLDIYVLYQRAISVAVELEDVLNSTPLAML